MSLPYQHVFNAAVDVIEALDEVGEGWSCFIGGMAAKLHGVKREVKDLDIIVLRPDGDLEDLQDALVEYDPDHFYLEKPMTRGAKFMKLKYKIPNTRHVIKVDLLLSTEADVEIPSALSTGHFVHINGLPVAPLYFVLYHKFVGWDERVDHADSWKRDKAATQDYSDIIRLCSIMFEDGVYPLSKKHMGRAYLRKFEERAEDFADTYGGTARKRLRKIGFDV